MSRFFVIILLLFATGCGNGANNIDWSVFNNIPTNENIEDSEKLGRQMIKCLKLLKTYNKLSVQEQEKLKIIYSSFSLNVEPNGGLYLYFLNKNVVWGTTGLNPDLALLNRYKLCFDLDIFINDKFCKKNKTETYFLGFSVWLIPQKDYEGKKINVRLKGKVILFDEKDGKEIFESTIEKELIFQATGNNSPSYPNHRQ